MEKAYKGLQAENYALREYVINLQARLLDATGDFPPAPPNVTINPSGTQPAEHGLPEMQNEQPQTQAKWGASPLEAVARAVADLAAEGEHQQGDQGHADTEMKDEPGTSRPAEEQPQQPGTQA